MLKVAGGCEECWSQYECERGSDEAMRREREREPSVRVVFYFEERCLVSF